MNRSLKLAQLEVSLCLLEPQIRKHERFARSLADPSQREEARIEAGKKRQEAEKIWRQIEQLEIYK
jgi:hypothetical protein